MNFPKDIIKIILLKLTISKLNSINTNLVPSLDLLNLKIIIYLQFKPIPKEYQKINLIAAKAKIKILKNKFKSLKDNFQKILKNMKIREEICK